MTCSSYSLTCQYYYRSVLIEQIDTQQDHTEVAESAQESPAK